MAAKQLTEVFPKNTLFPVVYDRIKALRKYTTVYNVLSLFVGFNWFIWYYFFTPTQKSK